MTKYIYTILMVFGLFVAKAQTTESDVLFTVVDEPVYASEFVRIFNKNLDLVQDESQKNVDEYLKLFVNYKLKLKEAKEQGLDEKPSYIRELSNYKKQLAKNYLTDSEVTDELVAEAYERISKEVNADHILIRLDENASPEDTLAAYNQLLKFRDRVAKEGFGNVQKDIHNGKTIYAENLGYFTGFKMVYPFETAAYNTPVGEISMPFKTRFGYHIVIVNDVRQSRGERTVAHIMVSDNQEDPNVAETRINDIYNKLQQGESFESLAKQFSDDKSSAKNGGKLAPFSGGQLSSTAFEEQAFDLENVGDVSKPFKTEFGWHIIKLFDKKSVESFEEMKPELEAKVKKDTRSQLINTSLVNNLMKKYRVTYQQPALLYFQSILNDEYFSGRWVLPEDFEGDKDLVVIDTKKLSYNDFGMYLLKSQRRATAKKAMDKLVEEKYQEFLDANLLQYQEENLENENEDFAHILAEYRDGLLLFDLMETEIWNAAKTDSVGLNDYYQNNKNSYMWNNRVDALVASSSNKESINQVKKMLEEGKSENEIKEALNTKETVNVIFTTGIMDKEHQALPQDFEFKNGISNIYPHNDAYIVASVNAVLPKEPKAYEDAKGQIMSDYQVYKEEKWLEELAKKYPVVINQEVLARVKKQIKS
ncbi:peptidylprolyl isomerase [Hanstruepera neustonica]|uniref:peptidylprolyl isomerase n=1 Tax=Hanstruepera neustonica TaxID=1445657 RepID=UPI001A9C8386|nr:peptidylprolyl isomerase [Hanstruepera neustonica]